MTKPSERDLEKSWRIVNSYVTQKHGVFTMSEDGANELSKHVAEALAAERASLPESVTRAIELYEIHCGGDCGSVRAYEFATGAHNDLLKWLAGEPI